jgi:hypothetical protein
MRRRTKLRDDRPRPPLPEPSPDRFQWRPMVEPVFGPPRRPLGERAPLLFQIVPEDRRS